MNKVKQKQAILFSFCLLVCAAFCFSNKVEAASRKPTKMTLNVSKKTIDVGQSYAVKVKSVKPKNSSKSVAYKSSNAKIATVSSKGIVKGKKEGTVKITVQSKKNKKLKKTVAITVKRLRPYSLKLNTSNLNLSPNETCQIKYTVNANNAVIFSSADSSIASVNKYGKITAKKDGDTIITVKTVKNSYNGKPLVKTCKVNVSHSHEYKLTNTENATCEKDGYKEYSCSICGNKYQQTLPATGHNYKLIEEKDATEKEDGYKKYRCEKCKKEYTDIVQKNEHEWIYLYSKEPTCEQDGYKTYICSKCNQYKDVTINKLGHDYVKIEHKDSSCGVQGYDVYKCSRCEKVDKRLLPFTDHELVKQKEDMQYIYYKCSRCGEDIKKYNDREYNIDLGNGKSTKVVGHFDLEMRKEIFRLCNENRKIFELEPMTLVSDNDPLQETANIRAVEISYFYNKDHLRPNGKKTLNSPEFHYININAENICLANDATNACEQWFGSPDHHKQIINGSNSRIGIAVFCRKFEDGTYSHACVQLFKS